MDTEIKGHLTLRQIADKAGVEIHTARYAIRSRNIAPAKWVGSTRLFAGADARKIINELKNRPKFSRVN